MSAQTMAVVYLVVLAALPFIGEGVRSRIVKQHRKKWEKQHGTRAPRRSDRIEFYGDVRDPYDRD